MEAFLWDEWWWEPARESRVGLGSEGSGFVAERGKGISLENLPPEACPFRGEWRVQEVLDRSNLHMCREWKGVKDSNGTPLSPMTQSLHPERFSQVEQENKQGVIAAQPRERVREERVGWSVMGNQCCVSDATTAVALEGKGTHSSHHAAVRCHPNPHNLAWGVPDCLDSLEAFDPTSEAWAPALPAAPSSLTAVSSGSSMSSSSGGHQRRQSSPCALGEEGLPRCKPVPLRVMHSVCLFLFLSSAPFCSAAV